MAKAGTVEIEFAAEVAKFNAQLKSVKSDVKGLKDDFDSFAGVLKNAGAALGAVVSAGAIAAFVKDAVLAADALGDMADRIGVSVESLSRLKFAAEQSDVSFESLQSGVKIFQKTLSEAGAGSDSAQQKFAALHLRAQDLLQLPLEKQFAAVADALQGIPNPADKARIAMDLFGKAGDELVPLLNRGKDGIDQLAKTADDSGQVLSANAAKGIDAFIKKIDELVGAFKTGTAEIVGSAIASLAGIDDTTAKIERLKKQRDNFMGSDEESLAATDRRRAAIDDEIKLLEKQLVTERALAEQKKKHDDEAIRFSAQIAGFNDQTKVVARQIAQEEAEQRAAEARARANEAERKKAFDALQADNREVANNYDLMNQRILNDQVLANLEAEQANQDHLDTLANQLADHIEVTKRIKGEGELALDEISKQFGVEQINYEELKNQTISSMALGLFTDVIGHNKKFAKAAQKIAIAETIWHTLTGMARALKDYPFPANIAVAGLIGAYGAAQVQKIKSTSVEAPSASLSGSGGAGATGANGPDVQDQITQAAPRRTTEVTISGTLTDSAGRIIADLVSDQIQNRDVVLFNASSRQAQELGMVGG